MSYKEVMGCPTVFTLYTHIKSQIYLTSPHSVYPCRPRLYQLYHAIHYNLLFIYITLQCIYGFT